jgi:uncharacterized membrane protein
MNWRKGLIRVSIVLTVIWVAVSLLIANQHFNTNWLMWAGDSPAQEGIYEQLRTNMRDEFLLLAIGGSVIWWIILYTMFWVVDGFRSSR